MSHYGLVSFQKDFLQHVFGVLAILGDAHRRPEDLAFIAPQEIGESSFIASIRDSSRYTNGAIDAATLR